MQGARTLGYTRDPSSTIEHHSYNTYLATSYITACNNDSSGRYFSTLQTSCCPHSAFYSFPNIFCTFDDASTGGDTRKPLHLIPHSRRDTLETHVRVAVYILHAQGRRTIVQRLNSRDKQEPYEPTRARIAIKMCNKGHHCDTWDTTPPTLLHRNKSPANKSLGNHREQLVTIAEAEPRILELTEHLETGRTLHSTTRLKHEADVKNSARNISWYTQGSEYGRRM
jgi:hypothetical protein